MHRKDRHGKDTTSDTVVSQTAYAVLIHIKRDIRDPVRELAMARHIGLRARGGHVTRV